MNYIEDFQKSYFQVAGRHKRKTLQEMDQVLQSRRIPIWYPSEGWTLFSAPNPLWLGRLPASGPFSAPTLEDDRSDAPLRRSASDGAAFCAGLRPSHLSSRCVKACLADAEASPDMFLENGRGERRETSTLGWRGHGDSQARVLGGGKVPSWDVPNIRPSYASGQHAKPD